MGSGQGECHEEDELFNDWSRKKGAWPWPWEGGCWCPLSCLSVHRQVRTSRPQFPEMEHCGL